MNLTEETFSGTEDPEETTLHTWSSWSMWWTGGEVFLFSVSS